MLWNEFADNSVLIAHTHLQRLFSVFTFQHSFMKFSCTVCKISHNKNKIFNIQIFSGLWLM